MTLFELGQQIQTLRVFTAVRESQLVYPILLSTHLASIATFGGLILATNLRLLGWLSDVPAAAFIRALRPWKQAGFVIMVTAGVLLGGAKASEYLTNPFFQTKMLLLAGVGVHGVSFRRLVYRTGDAPISLVAGRTAAILSIILWLGVVSMGRWIAYYDRPESGGQAASEAVRTRISTDVAISVTLPATTCATVKPIHVETLVVPTIITTKIAIPRQTWPISVAIDACATRLAATEIPGSWVALSAVTRTSSPATPANNRCHGNPII
jgi:hypothetical protein